LFFLLSRGCLPLATVSMSLRFDQVHGMPRAAPMVVATAPTGPAPKHKGKAIMAGGIAVSE
jgi:hypothetical protein